MSTQKMHDFELDIDTELVRKLLRAQFPQWSRLPIKRVNSAGTDNAIFRLGEDLCVRLPRILQACSRIERAHTWLPKFAKMLPLAIPEAVAKGRPSEHFPLHWSIFRWLEGETAAMAPIVHSQRAATYLAHFLMSLHKIEVRGGWCSYRSGPLHAQDHETRTAITSLHGIVDAKAALAVWEECLNAQEWNRPPVWTHGDLLSTNLLVKDGSLSAVIDFDLMGIGDPACDLIVAWSALTKESRASFRSLLAVDDATWARGRGWALSIALIILPYYRTSNPWLVAVAERILREIFADG